MFMKHIPQLEMDNCRSKPETLATCLILIYSLHRQIIHVISASHMKRRKDFLYNSEEVSWQEFYPEALKLALMF